MLNSVRLQISSPIYCCTSEGNGAVVSSNRRLSIKLPSRRHFASFTVQSAENAILQPSVSSELSSVIGSPPPLKPYQWNLTDGHIRFLSFVACAAAISATWLFCSAIPTLLAFKRAAESMEKLMDVTREELPDTMAAVRLSGMEISDLTMELSDLGQEITQGVRSSIRAVRLAEERLRRLTNMNPTVSLQEVSLRKTRRTEPALAKTARNMREGIVKGRSAIQLIFTLSRYSKMLLTYFTSRRKT